MANLKNFPAKRTLIEVASASVTYVGKHFGAHNAPTSDSLWTVQRINVVGSLTDIQVIENVSWDNRASLGWV